MNEPPNKGFHPTAFRAMPAGKIVSTGHAPAGES